MPFIHLHVHTPFSFLDGAARIDRLVDAAAQFEMPALAMTDHNNVSAAARFHQRCQEAGLRPIIGAEITLEGGFHLTLLTQNPRGYANLCRLITQAHLSQPRLQPACSLDALREHNEGLIALSGCRRGRVPALLLKRQLDEAEQAARELKGLFGPDRFFLEMQELLLPGTRLLNTRLAELAERLGVELVATNNVHHLRREDFPAHDVLTCARTLTKLDDVHPERRLNAQCTLRSPAEMAGFFRAYPQALETAGRIAERCEPALHPGEYRFPAYRVPPGETARGMLHKLVWQGARERYRPLTEPVRRRLEHELGVIGKLGFDEYFLVVWDLLRFAHGRGIRFAGRGSAADSAVAYCLGVTTVDPIARGLLFERFMSLERAAMPDIDVDFEAERRDDVMKYVIDLYGQEHVAMVATYNTFQARSAIRDLGKGMGFPLDEIDRLAKHLPYLPADAIEGAFDTVPELRDSDLSRTRYQQLLDIARAVAGFPRHLSTHLGGIVVTREPLLDISPVQMAAKGLPVIQFDKDDVEDLGLVKLDLLCLRMLSAIESTVRGINGRSQESGVRSQENGRENAENGTVPFSAIRLPKTVQSHFAQFDYEAIPDGDAASYDLVARSDTVGVFQLESPAQRALHARLQPSCFEDLVASVAIIRPGPILANMVTPYIARRQGKEAITYLHPSLERILGKTYGVVLFQEQVIEIATEVAGFTPGEADQLRRAMTHHRSWEEMEKIGGQFIQRARERGVEEKVAQEIFSYIQAYAGYGFCEAHAAAFADTAYRTAYLKAHYPAEFFAALLSHQPMGYYPPNTLIWEAKRRGIRVVGPDVNASGVRFTVEEGAIRVSLSQIRGMGEGTAAAIVREREEGGPFGSLRDFCRRCGKGEKGDGAFFPRDVCGKKAPSPFSRNMILAGAFDSLHPNRRRLLWEAGVIWNETLSSDSPLPLGKNGTDTILDVENGVCPIFPDFAPNEKWWWELDVLGIAIDKHPMEFVREDLRGKGAITVAESLQARQGTRVSVGGVVVRPHRPPTKSGRTVVFFTLEDETGLLDVTVFESVYQRCGKAIFTQPMVTVTGHMARRSAERAMPSLTAMEVEGYRLNPPSTPPPPASAPATNRGLRPDHPRQR